MAIFDCTLNAIQIPALEGYTPPFGTKKPAGGLSTQEVNDNILAPFAMMRPIFVSEDSSTSVIQSDRFFCFTAATAITFDIGSASHQMCKVEVLNSSAIAQSINIHLNGSSKTVSIEAGRKETFVWTGATWSRPKEILSGDMLALSRTGFIGVCDNATTPANQPLVKTVTIPDFRLIQGVKISVLFTNNIGGTRNVNSALDFYNLKLNVNGTGEKNVLCCGKQMGIGSITAGSLHDFIYDGASWHIRGHDIVAQEFLATEGYVKQVNGWIIQVIIINSAPLTVTYPVRYSQIPFVLCGVSSLVVHDASNNPTVVYIESVTTGSCRVKFLYNYPGMENPRYCVYSIGK